MSKYLAKSLLEEIRVFFFLINVKILWGTFKLSHLRKFPLNCFVISFPVSIQPLGKMDDYGIASFGVSVTTLEEVFMKVGEGSEKTVDDL